MNTTTNRVELRLAGEAELPALLPLIADYHAFEDLASSAEIDAAEAERARRLQASSGNAASMLAREDIDRRLREIRAALENCMREQGFRPA